MKLHLPKIQIIDEMSPLRFIDETRQMGVMPIRVLGPPQTEATAAPDSETKTERRNHVPRTSTNGNGKRTTVETAVEQIEGIKSSIKSARDGLNQLLDTLKQIQRDHKTSEREVNTVRSTLEKLQNVRI